MDTLEKARFAEVERALRLLRAGHDAGQVVEGLSRRLTNKLLHAPTRAIAEKERSCTSTS